MFPAWKMKARKKEEMTANIKYADSAKNECVERPNKQRERRKKRIQAW